MRKHKDKDEVSTGTNGDAGSINSGLGDDTLTQPETAGSGRRRSLIEKLFHKRAEGDTEEARR